MIERGDKWDDNDHNDHDNGNDDNYDDDSNYNTYDDITYMEAKDMISEKDWDVISNNKQISNNVYRI